MVMGIDYDGKETAKFFPEYSTDYSALKYRIGQAQQHLANGGTIHIELTKGARKGSIGRLDIQPEDLAEIYKDSYLQLTMKFTKWNLVFDDRKNVVKIEAWQGSGFPGVIHFTRTEPTVWAYTTNTKEPKLVPDLFDHFGTKIEIGSMVLAPQGTKGNTRTRFAYVKDISEAGTIKIESIKTRKGHLKTESKVSPTIFPYDLIVLDGDTSIKDKVLLAKLTHG
jgi:hypothetical protein